MRNTILSLFYILSIVLAGASASGQVIDYGPPTDALGHWEFDLYDASGNQRGTTTTPFSILGAQFPASLGQKALAGSLSVVIGTEQANALATNSLQTTGNNFLSQIATNTASALTDNVSTGTITAANGTVVLPAQGVYTVSVSLTGTWVGTMVLEGQLADSSWTILPVFAQSVNGAAQTLPYNVYYSTPTNGVFLVTGGGYSNIRVRAFNYTSGTVNVALEGSLAQQTNLVGQLGAWNITAAPADGTKATYSAAITGLVASATAPTDIFTITGSATKTVRVLRIALTGTQTTGAQRDIQLIKRSTANSGGTSTTVPLGPHDSGSAAATSVVRAYTANPTLGTQVAVLRTRKVYVATTAANSDEFIVEFGTRPGQAIVLRGVNETLAIHLNGMVSAGSSFDISTEVTEE